VACDPAFLRQLFFCSLFLDAQNMSALTLTSVLAVNIFLSISAA
jgi:hypothetical protein